MTVREEKQNTTSGKQKIKKNKNIVKKILYTFKTFRIDKFTGIFPVFALNFCIFFYGFIG